MELSNMKTLWKGSLNFGLVTIAIDIYAAIQEHAISFKLLHDECHTPIHNLRWCDHCDKEVSWEHVVKGLPLPDNKFFVITKEALAKLKPLKTDIIALTTFIDEESFDPIWSDEHYYVLPHNKDDRAYALFVQALEHSKKIAIGTIIFKEKEHICALRPYHNRLLMSTLHYAYEIRPLPPAKKTIRFTTQELQLAEYLIKKLSKKTCSLETFKDTFIEKLKKAITQKHGTTKQLAASQKRAKKKFKESLVETLQKSIKTPSKKIKDA